MRIIIPFCLMMAVCACTYKSDNRKAAEDIVKNVSIGEGINAGSKNYSLYVPPGWTTSRRTEFGIDYYFIGAPKTAADPNTNINVFSERMPDMSLEDYLRATIKQVKRAIPSAVILDQGKIEAHGLHGVWYKYNIAPRGIKATLVSYIFPKNGVAYVVTAGTQQNDADRYRNLFDFIARSFKLKE